MEGSFVVRNWGTMLIKGLLGLVFGIVLIVWPDITLKAIIKLFGIFSLLFGLFWAVDFFMDLSKKRKWGWSLALALIGIFIGFLALARTHNTAILVAYLFVAWLLAAGAIETAVATMLPAEFKMRWLLALEGILSIAAGLCLMLFTTPTVWVIVIFVGVYFILMGLIDIVVSFQARKFFKEGGAVVVVDD